MKTDKNILIAFILNLAFAIFEFLGGMFTNSVAIISDSVHDIADALSIGISYLLEKKSKNKPDEKYTYGYIRYSVIGSMITNLILLIGSILVVYNAIIRMFNPVVINYNGMIILAVFGVIINFLAANLTKEGDSLNQKSVNLHMLEDLFGWIIVLIGTVVMIFTNISVIDSFLSIIVALFIFVNAFKNLSLILNLFLEKTPSNIDIHHLKDNLLKIEHVIDIHHVHVWSIDGYNNYATLHVVTKEQNVKELVKEELHKHGIKHVTIQLETEDENCCEINCEIDSHHITHHH